MGSELEFVTARLESNERETERRELDEAMYCFFGHSCDVNWGDISIAKSAYRTLREYLEKYQPSDSIGSALYCAVDHLAQCQMNGDRVDKNYIKEQLRPLMGDDVENIEGFSLSNIESLYCSRLELMAKK